MNGRAKRILMERVEAHAVAASRQNAAVSSLKKWGALTRRRYTRSLLIGLLLGCSTVLAQNENADSLSNAVIEAATSIVSNALVQLSDGAITNEVTTNEVSQSIETGWETNAILTNLPSSRQPGPLESRRQWLLRQRAGTPATNDSGRSNAANQTNDTMNSIFRPAKPEFATFKLINERNIFDPSRSPRRRPGSQSATKVADSFSLVGLMSYEKGTFAFFNGNHSEYTKAVKLNDSIAGFKVLRIDPDSVSLIAGTNRVELRVGMQLRREEGGDWIASSQSEVYAANSSPSTTTHSDSTSSAPDNDILERLRKKREQE